jgi:ADP-ribose pyrophosphatase YjhB (NUDIX family)
MNTVLMAIAIIKNDNKILLRKVDPAKNPYKEPWALFGGRIDGEGKVDELINVELNERWDMNVSIDEKLWWDEEVKIDHDGETKLFVYLDALCSITSGSVTPVNPNEQLEWVDLSDLMNYSINPPSVVVLKKLSYL